MADETPRWAWDQSAKRYRDRDTGRFLASRRVHELRDNYVTHRVGLMDTFIADTVGTVDRTDSAAWRTAVRTVETRGWRRIENTLITEYVYGIGGIAAMTGVARATLRHLLREQKGYWRAYMREAEANPEKMTTRYMQNRAELYHRAGSGFHERGKAAAWDVHLPTYPGGQECGSRCGCSWVLSQHGDEIHAVWTRGKSDSCDDCVNNEAIYNPYIITRVQDEEAA